MFLTARIAGASLIAFLSAVLLGPLVIRWLKRHFRERIASASSTLNELHAEKESTPTMGGIFIMLAVLTATLLFADIFSPFIQLGCATLVSLTVLGACDDLVKQRAARNGLSVRQKLVMQLVLTGVVSVFLWLILRTFPGATFAFCSLSDGGPGVVVAFVAWSMLVLTGTCNAVNLTDGLDGLAAGCTILAGSAFAILAYLSGHRVLAEYLNLIHITGSGEVAVMLGALVGAMLGFLWFNCFPAQVFMGDAGSLPTGGLLALSALIIRQECLLVIIGGVFVAEAVSVLLQVSSFRLTGRRILRCSPLHNHFVFRGDPETRIVIRFWIVAALLAIAGLASLQFQ